MAKDDYRNGTVIGGADISVDKHDSVTLYDPIDAELSSQIKFDPNFKAYLTFFIHKNVPISNLDYFIGLNNPLNGKNGERKIIPFSYSIDLVSKLKKTGKDDIISDGPAKIKVIRYEEAADNHFGMGIKNLYENFALDRTLDSLFYNECAMPPMG